MDTEHRYFVEKCFWEAKEKNTVPPDEKITSSTWAMKNESDGTNISRLKSRGFEQEDCVNYTKDDVLETVVNDITINIVFILTIVAA